jgi:hypothetical protein
MTIPITPPEATVAITSEYHRWLIDRSDRLAEAERLLRECREFVDMHSEDWYRRGQELLRKIDAALSTADSAIAARLNDGQTPVDVDIDTL